MGDDEFLDEEGVAVGAFEDFLDEAGVGFGGEDAGELAVHLDAGEAGEFDAADGAEPVEFGEEGAQRVAPVDVVGAVAGDDHDPAPAEGAEEVGEEVPGGGVGPVEVLQDEHDRAVAGEAFQEPQGQFEEAGGGVLVGGLVAAGVAQFGQQAGELGLLAVGGGGEFVGEPAAEGAQCGGEGGEGEPVGAELDATAEGDDGTLLAGRVEELLDEPGLADPRLAADEQRLGLSRGRAGERLGEGGEFAGAADEHGTD